MDFNKASVTVIVCTYNRSEMLREALKSLVAQETAGSLSYEILIVDDASTDNTENVVREISRRSHVPIRYVLGEGKGIAAARNRGLSESSSGWIAYFDDDQLADPGWLRELYACAFDTGAGCVGGRRVLDLPQERVARLARTFRNLLGEVDLGSERKKCGRKEFPGAGNLLLKRSVFDVAGRFDESHARAGEDTELAQRMRSAGIFTWYAPAAVARHMTPEYRLKEHYMVWTSQRVGDNFAYRDYLEWGLARTTLACIARIGRAVMITTPIFVLAWMRGDEARLLEQKCLLWRAVGYTMHAFHRLMPRLVQPDRFFSRLEFRKERQTFSSGSNGSERAAG